MNIDGISPYKFTGTSNYSLDDRNYILAVKEDSYFSDRNIVPLFYVDEDKQVLEVDDEMVGRRIFVRSTSKDTYTEELSTRFELNELFVINNGFLNYNDRYDFDHKLPKSFTYKNSLEPLRPNEIIEIFDSEIDIKRSRIHIVNPSLREVINKKFIQSKQQIFCLFQNKIIGPFILIGSDDEGFIARQGEGFDFGIYKFQNDDYIEVEANGIERKIIIDFKNIKKAFEKRFDFISDKELIQWFEMELENKKGTAFNKNELNLIIDQVDKANGTLNIVENKDRYDRIAKILSESREVAISRQGLLNLLPQLQTIKEEIESDQTKALNLRNDIEKRNKEFDALQSRLEEARNEQDELEKKLDELRRQEQIEQDKIRQNIQNDISKLEQQRNLLDKELEGERKKRLDSLEDLNGDIEYKEKRVKELETAISTLKKNFTSEQKDAQNALSELVKQNTHFNFISGRDLTPDENEFNSFKNYSIDNGLKDYLSLRDGIIEILKGQQRRFENHFVDNLLISIHQNTLTLFAGLPGTGKTSLAKIITSSLTGDDRIKEIPVAKGWTSQKDLIGFSNPLTKKFHRSQTGFYDLLKQLNFEWENNLFFDSPLSYIILDEANLSPLEHYWSLFNNSTDSFATIDKPLKLNLGQAEVIKYANTLRFIGTINYDQTTEELSPRILDRASIIRLDPQEGQINSLSQNEITSLKLKFSDAIKMFELNDFELGANTFQISDDLNERFDRIKKIFATELNIHVASRIEIAIKRYCKVASTIMTEDIRPLDYCIAQRLLPLINIQSNKQTELKKLLSEITKFKLENSVSELILNRIIEIGSRKGYTEDNYNYFLTLTNV